MRPCVPPELLTDRYQLAMAASYLAQGRADDRVAFELFVRELPEQRGYLLTAGLETALRYLEDLHFDGDSLEYLERSHTCERPLLDVLAGVRFEGDIDAMPEGTVAFANEPILRIEGPRLVCQLAESFLLNLINFQTLIATKAARIVQAAAGRPVVDFGFRRAHGGEAGVLAARSSYIGGVIATATVAAGYEWGIPTTGTMSHSYVMGFPSELDAYCAFLRDQPVRPTLLIDTYETIHGARLAAQAASTTGIAPAAVRLDSGDVDELSREVRAVLDEAGLDATGIFCSGDLDEYRIAELVGRGAPIDGFGAGTRLVTGGDVSALGGVYKLVESAGRPVMKRSSRKATLPGRHQVFRSEAGDVIGLAGEPLDGTPLLQPVMRDGGRPAEAPPLDDIRDRARTEVAAQPERVRALRDPATVRPSLSAAVEALRSELTHA
ncbi:MAG TPA: nicotinate phosphoribosyltransferase [Gaiellales bacterium]|nr:nicotinate phosphoribosyltransferase [Gaiellales bacterium]